MPTQMAQDRSEHQAARWSILSDDFDRLLEDWLKEHVDEERLEIWGVPDTSANPISDMARQLTIPGLYGRRPKWLHRATRKNEGLVGPGGHLDKAGYHTKMQFVQYMTLGMGDMVVHMDVLDDELVVRPVPPQDVYIVAKVGRPDQVQQLWELSLVWWEQEERWVYVWLVYDVGDASREPSHRIYEAKPEGGLGDDVSNVFLQQGEDFGPIEGDAYEWRRARDGRPRVPYIIYRAVDTGKTWNHHDKRGAHRGTLNTALYHTYAGRCALDATGSAVMAAGLTPTGTQVKPTDSEVASVGARNTQTIQMTPGAIIYHEVDGEQQPFVKELGPGVNLAEVWRFAVDYEIRQGIRWGLNPADHTRQAANPSSAAALYINRQDKREFSAQVEPLFRMSDLDGVELAAIVLRVGRVAVYDEDGYSITYHEIPRSPQEEDERRRALEWKKKEKLISSLDIFAAVNPGTTREDALEAIVQARVDEARIEAAVRERLAELGIEAPTVPQPEEAIEVVDETRRLEVDDDDDDEQGEDEDG